MSDIRLLPTVFSLRHFLRHFLRPAFPHPVFTSGPSSHVYAAKLNRVNIILLNLKNNIGVFGIYIKVKDSLTVQIPF
jgi:hypothetical protein